MMGDRRFHPPKPEEREDWLLSYADMITLLLAFFVLLLSMSKLDAVKMETVSGGMAREIGGHENARPIEALKGDMANVMRGLKLDESKVSMGTDDRGLVLDLDAGTFFEPASAQLAEEYVPALLKMGETLNSPRYSAFQVEVDGHTDDTPVSTPVYPSNWELSAARATMVVRVLVQVGMAPTRLEAVGYADTRPKVPNRDAQGRPLPRNQAINRRVTLHIFPRQGSF